MLPSKRSLIVPALMCAAAFSFGCGEDEKDKENQANLQDGTWGATCIDDTQPSGGSTLVGRLQLQQDDTGGSGGGDGGGGSGSSDKGRKQTLKFEGTTFSVESSMYAEPTCVTVNQALRFTGTYVSGAEAAGTPTAVEGASNIDITLTTAEMSISSDESLAYANESGGCPSAVVKGTYFDVTKCTELAKQITGSDGPSLGKPWYTIFKATATSLQFGEEDETHDGTTPEKRSVTFEKVAYSKL